MADSSKSIGQLRGGGHQPAWSSHLPATPAVLSVSRWHVAGDEERCFDALDPPIDAMPGGQDEMATSTAKLYSPKISRCKA
jgi:hypothetical protein